MTSFAMICMSAVLPYTITLGDVTEHGTVAYRTPAHCAAGLIPEVATAPAAAAPEAKSAAAATPAKAKKKAAQRPCKKGRTRNSRGVCGRW